MSTGTKCDMNKKQLENIVANEDARNEWFEENSVVNKIADPEKCVDWWENLFLNMSKEHKSISKNSSKIKIQFRMLYFLISNRLYFYKLKKLFGVNETK